VQADEERVVESDVVPALDERVAAGGNEYSGPRVRQRVRPHLQFLPHQFADESLYRRENLVDLLVGNRLADEATETPGRHQRVQAGVVLLEAETHLEFVVARRRHERRRRQKVLEAVEVLVPRLGQAVGVGDVPVADVEVGVQSVDQLYVLACVIAGIPAERIAVLLDAVVGVDGHAEAVRGRRCRRDGKGLRAPVVEDRPVLDRPTRVQIVHRRVVGEPVSARNRGYVRRRAERELRFGGTVLDVRRPGVRSRPPDVECRLWVFPVCYVNADRAGIGVFRPDAPD